MGFKNLPPLAISSTPFQFLKSLDLGSVGLGLDAVPPCFGWELVVWKPLNEQFREKLERKMVEVFGEVHEVVEIGEKTSEVGKIDLELGIGDMPIHGVEDDPRTPVEPVPSVFSIQTLTSAKPRKKRLKTLAGRTDLPWVLKMLAQ